MDIKSNSTVFVECDVKNEAIHKCKSKRHKIGNALIAGGVVGSGLFIIAGILLFQNRLREVETQAFTIVGSNKSQTLEIGIENWLPLFILCLIFLAVCLFVISVGYIYKNKN